MAHLGRYQFSTTMVLVVLYMSVKPKFHFSHKGVKSELCLCCITYHILIIINHVFTLGIADGLFQIPHYDCFGIP